MSRPVKSANAKGQYRCSKCTRWKLPSEFYGNKNSGSGLTSQCKDCFNKYTTASKYRRAVAELVAGYTVAWPDADLAEVTKLAEFETKRNLAKDDEEQVYWDEEASNQREFLQTGIWLPCIHKGIGAFGNRFDPAVLERKAPEPDRYRVAGNYIPETWGPPSEVGRT